MENSFIGECVAFLYKKYGEDISNIKIVLPSKRASLFFNLELSRLIGNKPIWQPKFYSLDSIFGELSGLVVAERLKLLVVLYNIYSKYHKESFDQFYYWGDMLLNDFEAVDNYMVDARLLFENSADIKEIESRFDYLSQEDTEEIRRFWSHFGETRNSDEKEYFFSIWKTLFPIYTEFKERLAEEGIGYRGMIYRQVAVDILSGEKSIDDDDRYALIGFNALSNTEKILFDALKNHDFLWDSDDSYVKSKNSEAGLFLRPNIERYGEANRHVERGNYSKPKEITVLSAPSASMECKYVWEFLEKCSDGGRKTLGAETAIILTDESLLLPVLYSIPPYVAHFNVTAGYELRLTQAYSLTENIISLQTNYKEEFYYKDVESILSNPLIRLVLSGEEIKQAGEVISKKEIYYKPQLLAVGDFLSVLFTKKSGWEQISDYLLFLYNRILTKLSGESAETKEALFRAFNTISSLKILIAGVQVELSDNVFLSLLRKHLKHERISYEGEPLIGIQVMGILESRTLDFENVLLLSVGEENFPSKSMGASFIPSNLRHGYGLPTSNYHQAMYSYYFYRLLQRATRVDISYVSMGNEISSGEPSRYIHQLIYAREHNICQQELSLNITTSDITDQQIVKSGKSVKFIEGVKLLQKTLSASSLHSYIECPVKFYYSRIECIGEQEEREKELDAAGRGNVLHDALAAIYSPLQGKSHDYIIEQLSTLTVEVIEQKVSEFLSSMLGVEDFDANIKHSRKLLVHYIQSVINYDLKRSDNFTIQGVEVPIDGVVCGVKFYGVIDRIDMVPSGAVVVIDYKSEKYSIADSVVSLFDTSERQNNKPTMQSLLYALLYSRKNNIEVIPSLYYVREMNKPKFLPTVKIKSSGEIIRFSSIENEFETELAAKLAELLDIETPFYKCDNENKCKYCNFIDLCAI